MGLKKQIELGTGYTAEYFRISRIVQDRLKVKIFVDVYKDKAARDAGKKAVIENFDQKKLALTSKQDYSFEMTEQQFDEGDVYGVAYWFLKQLPEFSGAIDE